MSKYDPLWNYLKNLETKDDVVTLTFVEIEDITGFKFDHAFLTFKKELVSYGWQFKNLSLKKEFVNFERVKK